MLTDVHVRDQAINRQLAPQRLQRHTTPDLIDVGRHMADCRFCVLARKKYAAALNRRVSLGVVLYSV